jgi:hypothetical protein
MSRTLRAAVIGVLCALPIALIAAGFAMFVLDPTLTGPRTEIIRALGLGPLRGVAFGLGALISAAIVAPRLAREELGSFSGLAAFVLLAHLFAVAGAALEIATRDPGGVDAWILIAWPVGLMLSFGAFLLVWLPTGVVWVSAVRRLTIPDQQAPTVVERAQSEAMRSEAAREHTVIDATTPGEQGSRLWRNRG